MDVMDAEDILAVDVMDGRNDGCDDGNDRSMDERTIGDKDETNVPRRDNCLSLSLSLSSLFSFSLLSLLSLALLTHSLSLFSEEE